MIFNKIKIALAAAALVASSLVTTGLGAQNRPKTKGQIIKENQELSNEVDSLRRLLKEYENAARISDSIAAERTRKAVKSSLRGQLPAPEEYSPEVTDSLLNLWYIHKNVNKNKEGSGYNMDTVRFRSDVPDSVFHRRLVDMNSSISLPYNETVRNYIILYSEKMPTKMSGMLGLASYYMPIFEETFAKYDIPEELKYMAVIESALNPVAVSRAGAKGMWQFMYQTAKSYGLTINSYVDERLDPVKSADAAARYLRDAYRIFGDWSLAISSYNCGSGNVNKAIRRCGGSKDFWAIYDYLPRETRGYVPAFVGAMYAFNYYKEHGITHAPVQMPVHVDTFVIRKNLHFRQISELTGVTVDELRNLNPQYYHDIIPGKDKPYVLRLPYQYTGAFVEHEDSVYKYKADELFNPLTLENIRQGSTEYEQSRIYYKVKSGDYLGRIASKYRVTVTQLKKWNNLKSNNLRIGQKLVIYRNVPKKPAPAPAPPKPAPVPQSQAPVTQVQKPVEEQVDTAAPVILPSKDTAGLKVVVDTVKTADNATNSVENVKASETTNHSETVKTATPVASVAETSDKVTSTKVTADTTASSAAVAEKPAKETSSAGKEFEFYTVVKGDTLYGISKKYPGVTPEDIMNYNGISSNLQPGMKIKIPLK